MAKTLVFSTNYLPFIGGAELAIKEITERLPDMAFHLITPRYKGFLPFEEVLGNVRVHRVGFGLSIDKFLLPILGLFKAVSLHRRERFTLVWSMMASQASVAAALFKFTHRRIPLVLTLQEGDEEEHLRRYAFGIKWIYSFFIRPWHVLVFKAADLITVISRHLEARARLNNISVPIVLVPNGVDIALFEKASDQKERVRARKMFGFSESDFVISTVSRLVKKNRVDTLIRAISLLPPSYKLIIAGEGYLEVQLKNLASELGVTSRIIFFGRIEPLRVPEVLSASDVFARPSASEGFGSAFLEAMAAGVPVIAAKVGGIADFVTDKETGLFCEIGDSDDLARKITILTRDRILRDDIVERSRKMAREKYDWSRVALSMSEQAFSPIARLKPERILIASGIYPPEIGGPAIYAQELREAFWRRGYATDVVTYGFEKKLPLGIRHAAYFVRIFFPILFSDWIISLDTFSSGVPAIVSAKLLFRKIIVRIGGDFLWEQYVERTGEMIPLPVFYENLPHLSLKEKIVFVISRAALRRANSLIFSTDWQRQIWQKPYRISISRTSVIENYYGPKEKGIEPTRKNIIFAGRAIKLKNLESLKTAFARAQKEDSALTLELVSVCHEAFLERIRSAYAIAVPSLSEVSPNIVLEAIRFEKPFLLTEYNGLNERIGKLGIFVNPRSENSLDKGILELANPARYGELKKNLSSFSFMHSWDEIASEFVSIFRSL